MFNLPAPKALVTSHVRRELRVGSASLVGCGIAASWRAVAVVRCAAAGWELEKGSSRGNVASMLEGVLGAGMDSERSCQ